MAVAALCENSSMSSSKASPGLLPSVHTISLLLTEVATNVYYPFKENGFWSAQFIVDPEHWALLCHLDSTGLWRVSYGEKEGLTHEECWERLPAKFEALFPGSKPVKGQY